MKKWIILLILVTIPITLFANHWELKEGLTIWGLPKNITFVNDQIGYFSAGSAVYYTHDCGDTWNIMWVSPSTIYALFVLDEEIVYVGSDTGKIYKITDNGTTWSRIYNGSSRIYSICFINEDVGFAVGRYGTGIKTTNGGSTWTDILYNYPLLNRRINFVSDNTLIITGEETLMTTNLGNSWYYFGISQETEGFYSFDANDMWLGGYDYVYHFDNANITSYYFGDLIDPYCSTCAVEIDFINDQEGWCCTDNYQTPEGSGYIFHTTNGGATWQEDDTANILHKRVTGLCMINENKGFAGGYYKGSAIPYCGCLYEYVEDVNVQPDPEASSIYLYQNYPNPFKDNTHIKFNLKNDSQVSVNVYNIKGEFVTNLTSDRFTRGSHEIIWDGKDNSKNRVLSGVYMYEIKTDKYVQQKKLLLIN
jgi:photosystem II stability/assembly factor-like uncharacterized protein